MRGKFFFLHHIAKCEIKKVGEDERHVGRRACKIGTTKGSNIFIIKYIYSAKFALFLTENDVVASIFSIGITK